MRESPYDSIASSLSLIKENRISYVKPTPKPIAYRTILPHTEACYICSQRLQSCNSEGKVTKRPVYIKGPCICAVGLLDGYERKMHIRCAVDQGFKIE